MKNITTTLWTGTDFRVRIAIELICPLCFRPLRPSAVCRQPDAINLICERSAKTFCRSSFPSRIRHEERGPMEDDGRPKPPDLQECIEKYGAYWKIPWHEWDAANAKYQHDRRGYLGGPLSKTDRTAIKRRARRR